MIIGHSEQLNKLQHLVDQKRVPHLFLFVGPSGVGKKKVALELARKLGCNEGSTMLVEPDGASIKIDQTREVIEFCQLAHREKARMIIIDQMEKMNPQAANSLLKLFEEPPPQTYFVLLAPSPSSVLTTIRSRSQVVRFGALSPEELKRGMPEAPPWILQSAGGRFDRAELLQNEDLLDLRSQALGLLKASKQGRRADVTEALKQVSPNRDKTQWLIKFWREFLRDAWLNKLELEGSIHTDMQSELGPLFNFTAQQFSDCAEQTQKLENAMHSNYDIQMSLENYLAGFGR